MIDEPQAWLIVGGSYGGGTLDFQGDSLPFKAKGLKLDGVEIHIIHLTGDVYKLGSITDFSLTLTQRDMQLSVCYFLAKIRKNTIKRTLTVSKKGIL